MKNRIFKKFKKKIEIFIRDVTFLIKIAEKERRICIKFGKKKKKNLYEVEKNKNIEKFWKVIYNLILNNIM